MKGYTFDFTTIKGQQLCYIHMYLLINGVIEIDKLLEILETNHNFKISKEELLELVGELTDIKVMDNYICISGVVRDLAYQTIDYKNQIGNYKIIDKLEEIEKQYNKTILDIENACKEFFDDDTTLNILRSAMLLSGITSKILNITLKNQKIILSNYDRLQLLRKLEECQKSVRVWCYNGFTKDELFEVKGKKQEG